MSCLLPKGTVPITTVTTLVALLKVSTFMYAADAERVSFAGETCFVFSFHVNETMLLLMFCSLPFFI